MSCPADPPASPAKVETTASPSTSPSPDLAQSGPGVEVRFHHSDGLPRCSRQRLARCWSRPTRPDSCCRSALPRGKLTLSFRGFDHAMGVAVGSDCIAVAGKGQIWMLRDHTEVASAIAPAGRYDRCWLPRSSVVTGTIQCHEIAWGDQRLVPSRTCGSSTRCSPAWPASTSNYSFVPRWRPPFISQLAAQDRCHLNGLAMREGNTCVRDGHGSQRPAGGLAEVAERQRASSSTWPPARR